MTKKLRKELKALRDIRVSAFVLVATDDGLREAERCSIFLAQAPITTDNYRKWCVQNEVTTRQREFRDECIDDLRSTFQKVTR